MEVILDKCLVLFRYLQDKVGACFAVLRSHSVVVFYTTGLCCCCMGSRTFSNDTTSNIWPKDFYSIDLSQMMQKRE